MAVKTKTVQALFDTFNKIAPNRDKASDGWIGNAAHKKSVSGHNPDDTPGSKAERNDGDGIPEVRGADVDKDLHAPFSMEDCVQAILRSPEDRDRFIYIIYNRRIWSKSSGWKQRAYTGSNPHDKHAHFSGDPKHDNNSAPFKSLERLVIKEEVKKVAAELTQKHLDAIHFVDNRVEAITHGRDKTRTDLPKGGGEDVWIVQKLNAMDAKLDQILAKLDA